jgi:hypothetical protein
VSVCVSVCVYTYTHRHTQTHTDTPTHTPPPLSLSLSLSHTHTHTHTHRSVLKRLEGDTGLYSTSMKERKSRGAPAIKGMSDPEIRTVLANKSAALKGLIDAISQVWGLGFRV